MFSVTDAAEMMWDSDSDDGEMDGGSDVEVNNHVSSFSVLCCRNFIDVFIMSLSRVSLLLWPEQDYVRSVYIDFATHVMLTVMIYNYVDIIWIYDLFQLHNGMYK